MHAGQNNGNAVILLKWNPWRNDADSIYERARVNGGSTFLNLRNRLQQGGSDTSGPEALRWPSGLLAQVLKP